MLEFLVKRGTFAVFVVATVITIVFLLMYAIGDPCAATLGPSARQEQIQQCKVTHGYDRHWGEQYLSYLGVTECIDQTNPAWDEDPAARGHCGILQGDLRTSLVHNEDVAQVVLRRLPRTLLLSGMAMGFEIVVGILIGIVAAIRRNTAIDTGIMATAFVGISAPTFLTGLIFLYFFAFRLGWFPVGGYGVGFWDNVHHAVLPAFTLAIIGIATYARIMRSEMVENMRSDYVRTAQAKGLGPVRVVFAHGVRNALLPIVTLMGLQLALLVSGALITETIFAWPGVGRLAIQSITSMDAPVVMGVVIMVSVTVQLGNFLADVAVAGLDPRVRTEGK